MRKHFNLTLDCNEIPVPASDPAHPATTATLRNMPTAARENNESANARKLCCWKLDCYTLSNCPLFIKRTRGTPSDMAYELIGNYCLYRPKLPSGRHRSRAEVDARACRENRVKAMGDKFGFPWC